jgi:predicted phosphodiesterase
VFQVSKNRINVLCSYLPIAIHIQPVEYLSKKLPLFLGQASVSIKIPSSVRAHTVLSLGSVEGSPFVAGLLLPLRSFDPVGPAIRKFTDFKIDNFELCNKLVLELDQQKAWFFHGDVFDVTMQHSKWLAKLGGVGYDMLILINRFVNYVSEKIFKKGKISFSKKIKNSVKSAIKFINNFENTAAEIGIHNEYDYVICGHIHHPEIKLITNNKGSISYLNSGDWIENLTSLEYVNGTWTIHHFNHEEFQHIKLSDENEEDVSTNNFDSLIKEFNILN